MRHSILKARAEEAGAELAPDVLDYLASEVIRNIRELEGNLNRVLAYSKLLRSTVTPDMARRALKNLSLAAVENKPTEPQLLLAAVAESFELTVDDLLGRKRDKETAGARQVAMFIMKNQKVWSLGEIGRLVGDRTAATVSHACDKIANEVEYNPLLKRKLNDIESRLSGR
jgi:chromosomal replication initiator protein